MLERDKEKAKQKIGNIVENPQAKTMTFEERLKYIPELRKISR